jgi:sugar phosphate isomerase/epimerase
MKTAPEANGQRKIAMAHLTLFHLDPPDLVSAAAAGGFDSVTIRLMPAHPGDGEKQFPMLGNSPMMEETLRRLDDTGLYVHDIEVIRLKPDTKAETFLPMMEGGARLKARYVVAISDDTDDSRIADTLAKIAEQASGFGMKTAFEFMFFTGVKTIQQADRVIDLTGRSDITLLIDPIHLSRSGGTVEDVKKIDPARLSYLQFCDAAAKFRSDELGGIRIEARRHRLPPGAGALPLTELLAATPVDAALSVECPVEELRAKSDIEIARIIGDATRAMADADAAARLD